ncbi:MAG: hypothetical protein E7425_07720 [Ruminococcaceae bacterium]|nr:hypothetical protein [Oscillospiraceae bacterium]
MARRLDLSRCVLPGQDGRAVLRSLSFGLPALAALLLVLFGTDYRAQRQAELERFRYYAEFPGRILADHVNYIGLQPFWTLADLYLLPALVLGVWLFCFGAASNYRRCRSGARCDYTLRRLRDPWEYHRRCLAMPLLEALACLLTFLLLTGLFYAIYRLCTPTELLPPVGQRFWG